MFSISIIPRNYVICLKFLLRKYGKSTTRMVIVWGQCGKGYFLWRFYGKISLEIVFCFQGEKMTHQIITQS